MKLCAIVFLCAITLAFAQDKAVLDALDFMKGFGLGLHLEKLSPVIGMCINATRAANKAFVDAIAAYQEHQPFYDFVNNATIAIGKVSKVTRYCASTPSDVWRNLDEKYFKKFNYTWENYFHAVFLNLGYRMDEIAYSLLKAKSYFEAKDYPNAGYYLGNSVNIVVNVTSDKPVPPPPPSFNIQAVELTVGTNWTDIHSKFLGAFNYTITTLNYTHWVNETTAHNLNHSIIGIELKAYTAIMCLTDPKHRDVLEAVLSIFDMLEYDNTLFNGIYYTVKQLPKAVIKNSIFEHIKYAPLNFFLHLGFVIWDGSKMITDIKTGNTKDMVRRIATIFRKIIYFDEDTLEEILSDLPTPEL